MLKYDPALQRQDTLLVEYKNKQKTNRFVDQRIGENDPSASLEDKLLERFASEKKVRQIILHSLLGDYGEYVHQ